MLVFELYDWAVALLAILNLSLCGYILANRHVPGSLSAAALTLAIAFVCAMFVLLLHTSSIEAGYAYARLRFLGIAFVSPLFLVFVLQYTRQSHWLTFWPLLGIFSIPLLTQFILWFTPGHLDFLHDWTLIPYADHWLESRTLGGWYYIHALHGGATLVLALGVLVWYSRRVDTSRSREVNILFAVCIFTAYGVGTSATIGPAPGLRLTPLVLGAASPVLGWLLILGSAVRVVPIAFDLVFSTIHDAVLVLDSRRTIIRANPAAGRMLRLPLTSLVSQPVDAVMQAAREWQSRRPDASPFNITLADAEAPILCEVRHLPLSRDGRDIGSVVVMRDITAERKGLELTIERERSRVVATFIADASHEFRTPLSVIRSSAYLLGRLADSEKGERHVSKINDHVERINSLVDDLELMASLDAERQMGGEPIDVRQIVRDVVEAFARPLAEARGQTVTLSLEPGLPIPRGESSELILALEKVLHNAVRYTPDGGSIAVTARPHGAGAQITVTDTGVGMDNATAQAALKRFYRLDSARTTAGFGLGLPIALRIMQRHGGDLTLTSAPGVGTTVVLTLA